MPPKGGAKSKGFVKALSTSIRRAVDPLVFPVRGRLSGGIESGHRALDLAAPYGSPVYAARSGVVILGGGDPGYGRLVRVQEPRRGIESLYAHLAGVPAGLRSGQTVRAGQLIGYVGSSGHSSGPHLHFEVNPIGPERFNGGRSDVRALDPIAFLRGATMPSGSPVGLNTGALQVISLAGGPGPKKRPKTTAEAYSAREAMTRTTESVLAGGALGGLGVAGARAGIKGANLAASVAPRVSDKLLGVLGGPTYTEAGVFVKRLGFTSAGVVLLVLGIVILVYSLRNGGSSA